jgi:two-component system sensor histidine kinase TtrS
VNDLVRESVELALGEARWHNVEIHFDLVRPLPEVLADRVQIQQVLVNLLKNAYDSTAANKPLDRHVIIRTRVAGDIVEISVTDNGEGMSQAVTDRLFEPFFSTKPDGMGLGLAISRSIVENHGGRLAIRTNLERGVTVYFTLAGAGSGGD